MECEVNSDYSTPRRTAAKTTISRKCAGDDPDLNGAGRAEIKNGPRNLREHIFLGQILQQHIGGQLSQGRRRTGGPLKRGRVERQHRLSHDLILAAFAIARKNDVDAVRIGYFIPGTAAARFANTKSRNSVPMTER